MRKDERGSPRYVSLEQIMGRNGLQKALYSILDDSKKHGLCFSVILFSIDRFKLVNSRFGHTQADNVLKRVAETATATLGQRGLFGRWGADEFLCLLAGDSDHGFKIAEELRQAIENVAIPIDSSIVNATASFGVASYPEDGSQVKPILVAADEALHQAKKTGRNRVVWAGSLQHHIFRMGGILETALREDRVMPAYQPIVDLHSGTVVAEEALARIITVDGKVIGAEEFIEAASQFQLTHKIDRSIVLSAFNRYADSLHNVSPLTYFINISGDLLRHPHVLKDLLNSAKIYYDDHKTDQRHAPVIEVTERELLGDLEATRRTLAPFLDFGLRLAIDDFGSGYSSFQYLADLPISFLKIDGRLIKRIQEPKVRAIVHGIQSIATELNLITLAEYIETKQQAEILREAGINWGQGYYYGEAVINQNEADIRRQMSVNWAQGYYYQKSV